MGRANRPQALAAARRQASFGARRLGLSCADRDDLHQDILLAIVERADRFDARRGGWVTFVRLLARHVVADRLRADRSQQRVVLVPIDLMQWGVAATLGSATLPDPGDDAVDTVRRIDLDTLPSDLPPQPRETLLLLMQTHGDVAAAQRASGRSCSAFYRSIDDLRMWLRAAGLGVTSHPRGKNRRLDR